MSGLALTILIRQPPKLLGFTVDADGLIAEGSGFVPPRGRPHSVVHMVEARNLPRYRVLTGPDDETFCWRVSEALDLGYELHGAPSLTFNGDRVIVAQALIRHGGGEP